ncbi:hypothetical protein [Streptoalloteichus hindustanus]|uniref:Uncharacterized protein n=1 Tax=Streptoalloteichus hindustanus TaxID=2017 RepID=A0A1M5CMT0_STRHI|nr:hypothetical protein [Streptoalloteichus hindustanus]SHF55917.1 hypothetical protein SAMN05444320_10489 [Streptoalloteichus hindustanus]
MTDMTTPSTSATPNPTDDEDPSQGKPVARTLHELARPLFFAGQMLTEDDLTALVTWVQDRLWLATLRQGWGVVRGLHLSAAEAAKISVAPGCAVTPNGDDVVVPKAEVKDLTKDLSSVCTTGLSCVVDLVLRYAEEGYRPVKGLRAPGTRSTQDSQCGSVNGDGGQGGGQCDNSRMAEKFCLEATPVTGNPEDPADWTAWQKSYCDAVQPLQKSVDDGFPGTRTPDDRRKWLRALLSPPPQRHSFLVAAVEKAEMTDRNCLELLLWITLDRLDGLVRGPVPAEQIGDVRLGRVWLTRPDEQSPWAVQDIRTTEPYRTVFGRSVSPAPQGETNLTEIVGADVDEVDPLLGQRGITVSEWVEWVPDSNTKLKEMLKEPLRAKKGALVRLSYFQSQLPQVPQRRWIVGVTSL